MTNPRLASIRAATRTTRGLLQLFEKLGSILHPRGRIMVAYRNAHRAIRDIARRYPAGGPIAAWEVREVMGTLQRDVRETATISIEQAAELGRQQAEIEAAAWGFPSNPVAISTAPTIDAWTGLVESQARQGEAVISGGGDWAYVLGDDARLGLVQPGPVINEGAKYLTMAAMLALSASVAEQIAGTGMAWGKQAIAAIDSRTTDCCLQVNGQVVPFDGKFRLTGTPRFADEMDWSPFHWYCRTSIATVPIEMAQDDMTDKLKADAALELAKREEASGRILEIVEELAKSGAMPDARIRADDTAKVKALREELKGLRQRGGYPGG